MRETVKRIASSYCSDLTQNLTKFSNVITKNTLPYSGA